jgi:dihydroflavonol-4-reductase
LNLITGASGILGSHVLLQLMMAEKPVIAGKQKNSDLKKTEQLFSYYGKAALFKKILWKDVDVCDVFSLEEAFEGVSTVYHCAGFVSFNLKDRARLFKVNDSGTANVVTACLEKKVGALCHVSSIATINNSDYKDSLHEGVFWKRNGKESDYALSKYNAERQVWRGMEEGLNALIVNPGVIISPGFWTQSSSRLISTSSKGNLFYTSGKTGYIAGRDAAALMIVLTEKKQFANRYILIENNYSFKHIFDHIAAQFGKPKTRIRAGSYLLATGRILDYILSRVSGKEQVLTKFIIHSALNRQSFDNTKVKALLNFKFTPVDDEIAEVCRLFALKEPFRRGNNL